MVVASWPQSYKMLRNGEKATTQSFHTTNNCLTCWSFQNLYVFIMLWSLCGSSLQYLLVSELVWTFGKHNIEKCTLWLLVPCSFVVWNKIKAAPPHSTQPITHQSTTQTNTTLSNYCINYSIVNWLINIRIIEQLFINCLSAINYLAYTHPLGN